jgi:putative transposase
LDKEQEEQCEQWIGCCRLVFNLGLEQRETGRLTGNFVNYVNATNDLPELKAEYEFLQQVPAQVLQQALKDLERAFLQFFKQAAKWPRYRRKGTNNSFRYPQGVCCNDPARNNQVFLPKLGWVRLRNAYPRLGTRAHEGELKYTTVSRAADGWYISFTCEVEVPTPDSISKAGKHLGLDMGIVNSVTTSKGDHHQLPTMSDREQKKLQILHRKVSSKARGSKNQKKAAVKLAKYYKYLRDRKVDAVHKLTTSMVKQYGFIVSEALQIKNMTKSASGTIEEPEPGTNVAQKSGLNRAILVEQIWGESFRQLTYKSEWYGSLFARAPAHYSSQECSECAHISQENRESQAVFHCKKCGHKANADVNAAVVILQRGLEVLRTDGTLDPGVLEGFITPNDHEGLILALIESGREARETKVLDTRNKKEARKVRAAMKRKAKQALSLRDRPLQEAESSLCWKRIWVFRQEHGGKATEVQAL